MPATSTAAQRGRLLLEYLPPRAHPIVYAGLVVFAFVLVTGSLENLARDNVARLYAVYALPLAVTIALLALLWPTPVRLHEHGVAPARPLLLRWWRPFLRWDRTEAVYPSYYDVTGAFVSPFASSDGKVTQMGLRLEMQDGHKETLRFTPTRFVLGNDRSAGFDAAMGIVRDTFARLGRPLTRDAEELDTQVRREMLDEATRPFLPFMVIVLLFAGAAPVLAILLYLGVHEAVALAVALSLPLGTSLRSYVQSRRRSTIFHRLARVAEAERGRRIA